jgi:hypothetical protein
MWRCSQQKMAAEEMYRRWRNYMPLGLEDLGPPGWRISDDPVDVWSRMLPMDDECYIIMHIDNELLGRHIAARVLVSAYRAWGQWELLAAIPAEDITWMELHLRPVTLELSDDDAMATGASPAGATNEGSPTGLPTAAEPAGPTADGQTPAILAEATAVTFVGPTEAGRATPHESCGRSRSRSR